MNREPINALERHACQLNYAWYVDMLRELDEGVLEAITSALFNPTFGDGDERAKIIEHLMGCGITQAHANEIVDACLEDARRANSSCWSHIKKPTPENENETPPESVGARGTTATATVSARVTSDDAKDVIRTTGRVYDAEFLRIIDPLFDLHMGAENMGPMLYSLTRFFKPSRVLEVGAGYTSIFLLQALEDNSTELAMYRDLRARGRARIGHIPWSVDYYDYVYEGTLHVMDNMAHHATTAHLVEAIATKLGINDRLRVHVADAFNFDLASTLEVPKKFDLLWIDLGAANRISGFFDAWWNRVNPSGGLVLVHSTLTNELSRHWLESMREIARDPVKSPYGAFVELSLLEPMKMFQNSFTIFQRRGEAYGKQYEERVLTKYP